MSSLPSLLAVCCSTPPLVAAQRPVATATCEVRGAEREGRWRVASSSLWSDRLDFFFVHVFGTPKVVRRGVGSYSSRFAVLCCRRTMLYWLYATIGIPSGCAQEEGQESGARFMKTSRKLAESFLEAFWKFS